MRVTKACVFFKIEVYIAVPSKKAPIRYYIILVVQLQHQSFKKGIDDVQGIPHALLADEKRLPAKFLTGLNQFGEVV